MLSLTAGCGFLEDATTVPVEYDVELIEPVEFDGSQALAPATLSVAVSSTSPEATTTVPDAGKWGPLLRANQIVEDAGEERIFSISSAGAPTFTGTAPVSFSVEVFSVNDVVWGSTLSPDPVDVASCTFVLDPATAQADAFGNALEDCVVDWADSNGIPAELGFTVSSSTVAAAGPAADYTFSSVHTMETTEAFEIDCESEIALPDSVTDRVDDITFEGIQLDAVGTANDPVFVSWFGFIFDSEGTRVANGAGADALAGGQSREYHAVVVDGDVTTTGDANVILAPADPASFLDNIIRALAGLDTGSPGGGAACWFSFGAVPRSGSLSVVISGDARAGL